MNTSRRCLLRGCLLVLRNARTEVETEDGAKNSNEGTKYFFTTCDSVLEYIVIISGLIEYRGKYQDNRNRKRAYCEVMMPRVYSKVAIPVPLFLLVKKI